MYVFGPTGSKSHARFRTAGTAPVPWPTASPPRRPADWGVIGLVAAFGFLALGFWMSLRKQPDVPHSDEPAASPPAG